MTGNKQQPRLSTRKLKQLQAQFLMQFPKGFDDPAMKEIIKKHRMAPLIEFTQHNFSPMACSHYKQAAENMIKVVSRSSMVSMFEKPKFRDFVRCLSDDEKAYLVHGLSEFLHGDQQSGFEAMLSMLKTHKLAKWSLMTAIPTYYAPNEEVFVKPTTAKNILNYFQLDDPVYKPQPSWEFYQKYRSLIMDGKQRVNKNVSPSNAAFTGFLMMTCKPIEPSS